MRAIGIVGVVVAVVLAYVLLVVVPRPEGPFGPIWVAVIVGILAFNVVRYARWIGRKAPAKPPDSREK